MLVLLEYHDHPNPQRDEMSIYVHLCPKVTKASICSDMENTSRYISPIDFSYVRVLLQASDAASAKTTRSSGEKSSPAMC